MKLTVHHEPIGQPRPRARVLPAKPGAKPIASMYDDKKHPVTGFKAAIREAAEAAGVALTDKPISLELRFFFPRPQRLTWKRREMPRCIHGGKPDLDNLAKAFLDALNGIAWADDAQVWNLRLTKWYCDGKEVPHVEAEWFEDEADGIGF